MRIILDTNVQRDTLWKLHREKTGYQLTADSLSILSHFACPLPNLNVLFLITSLLGISLGKRTCFYIFDITV